MKRLYLFVLTVSLFILTTNPSWSRLHRINQIPNGTKFSCANCHINPSGGGLRNPFGHEVELNYLQGLDVEWKPALAALDSDGDGNTNGQEIQDPTGNWRIGDPPPGNESLVTNPGVADNLVAPALQTPADNSTGVSFTAQLIWSQVQGAESYRVEVSESINFSSYAYKIDPATSTTTTTTELKPNKYYYWRVRAQASSTTGPWSTVFRFKTKLSAPVPALPAQNATGVGVPTQFKWTFVDGAVSYVVEVSSSTDFSNPIVKQQGITDTTITVTDLEVNKTYFWRVRADDSPQLSDWSQVMIFNTQLPGPTPVSPASGTIGVEPNAKLVWNKLEGVSSYNLQIDADNNFTDPDITRNSIEDTTITIDGLDYNRVYYWRVNGGVAPEVSKWSDVWNFRVKPPAPKLVSPAMNVFGVDTLVTLVWNRIPGVTGYKLEVSSTDDFVMPFDIREHLTDTSAVVGGLSFNEQYYWRVAAQDPALGEMSEPGSFRTGFEPPVQTAPANAAVGVSLSPSFKWTYNVPGNYKFEIQFSKNLSFTGAVRKVDGKTYDTAGLESYTKYYWRVRAVVDNKLGVWSQPWSFTTKIGAPQLIYPENDADGIAIKFTARWNPVNGAESYAAQLASDAEFSNVIKNLENVPGAQVEFSELNPGVKYFWRVRAIKGTDLSDWSEARSFTTGMGVPSLMLPENGAIDQPLSLMLSWGKISSAVDYAVQVARDENFSDIYREELNNADTTLTLTDLPWETTFYWRVRSNIQNGASPWSEVRSFTTQKDGSAFDVESKLILIAPNPVANELNAEFSFLQASPVKIYVVDALGRVCLDLGVRIIGVETTKFDISSLPAGSYRLIVVSDNAKMTRAFIKL